MLRNVCLLVSMGLAQGSGLTGPAVVAEGLLCRLVQQGYKISAILINYDPSTGFLRGKGVAKYSLGFVRNVCAPISIFPRLIRLLKTIDPDIIHAFGEISAGYLLATLRKAIGKPSIITITKTYSGYSLFLPTLWSNPVGRISNHIQSRILGRIDHITCLNHYLEKQLIHMNVPKSNITVIGHGIKDEFVLPRQLKDAAPNGERTEKTVLFWGYGSYQRGFHTLLYSVNKILNKMPKTRFLIAVRSFDPDLERIALKLAKKQKQVEILSNANGQCCSISDHVASADVVALPYIVNPMEPPLTLLESMAMGKAVVTTNVGGNNEVITDLVNGILIDANDSSKLAESIIYLLDDDKRRMIIGDNARLSIKERFRWDCATKKLTKIYKQIATQR